MNLGLESISGEAKTPNQIEQELLTTGKPVPTGLARQAYLERQAIQQRSIETKEVRSKSEASLASDRLTNSEIEQLRRDAKEASAYFQKAFRDNPPG